MSVNTTYQEHYWTYATDYEVDKNTGKFSLVNPQTCKYNESGCITDKVKSGNNIYIVLNYAPNNTNTTNTLISNTTNLSNLYRITDATNSASLKCKRISNVPHSIEHELSMAPDAYGNSYYYRGGIKDNYLELNNVCFRIVRIEGDGSIKLTLAKEGTCSSITSSDINSALINNGITKTNYGYTYEEFGWDDEYNETFEFGRFDYENSPNGMYNALKTWYNAKLNSVQSKLKYETWYFGDTLSDYEDKYQEVISAYQGPVQEFTWSYKSALRLNNKNITYQCSSGEDVVTEYIGALTADEFLYSGGGFYSTYNNLFYLAQNVNSEYFLLTYDGFCTIDYGDCASSIDARGFLTSTCPGWSNNSIRPAVTLKSGTLIDSGDGTQTNPYKIK